MRKTTDGVAILRKEFVEGDPQMEALVAAAKAEMEIGLQIRRLRESMGLTQQQLAERVGTSRTVISRLEGRRYRGYSVPTLLRVAAALECDLDLRLKPRDGTGERCAGVPAVAAPVPPRQ